jgi:DNA-binding IclR family transcriptional regulator
MGYYGRTSALMTPSTVHHTAIALRLARESEGVTPSRLAAEASIHRSSAHAILVALWRLGELTREGGVGRHGHTYREVRNE